jgi:hypothetical protein
VLGNDETHEIGTTTGDDHEVGTTAVAGANTYDETYTVYTVDGGVKTSDDGMLHGRSVD